MTDKKNKSTEKKTRKSFKGDKNRAKIKKMFLILTGASQHGTRSVPEFFKINNYSNAKITLKTAKRKIFLTINNSIQAN